MSVLHPHTRVGEAPKIPDAACALPSHMQYPHNQERFLEKFSPSPRHLPQPAGSLMGFAQQQALTGAQGWEDDMGGGDSPGELGRGRRAAWREERQGGGASAEVLAPREAHWRPPGKKGLVLAEERGGEQRIHSKAQAGLRVPRGAVPGPAQRGKGGNQVLG